MERFIAQVPDRRAPDLLNRAIAGRGRMDEVLWRHTESSGVTVSALPVSLADFRRPVT
jgi:hypothetical protein